MPEVLVLDFEEFTQYPDKSVQKINEKFGMDLKWKAYDQGEQRAIRRYLAKHDERTNRAETNTSLPNSKRNN